MQPKTNTLRVLMGLAALLLHSTISFSQHPDLKSHHAKILRTDGQAPPFKAWLEQDVAWIITDEERAAFDHLHSDEQRDQFVEAFWARRDPTPDTYENEFKEEHYRRIVYANEHFGGRDPGWKTDRGRIYILYGPPDRIDSYAAGQAHELAQGGEADSRFPTEVWRYRYLERVGMDVALDFVDVCNCGDYRMSLDHDLKDVLLYVPGQTRRGHAELAIDTMLFLAPPATPKLRFPDLQAKLNSKSETRELALEFSANVIRATDITSLVPITIRIPRVGVISTTTSVPQSPTLNLMVRVSTITGHVDEIFEDKLAVDNSGPEYVLQKILP